MQRVMRSARLDPGSVLRTVRDDVPARCGALSGTTPKERKGPLSGMTLPFAVIAADAGIQSDSPQDRWIPARCYAPSGMTYRLGAARHAG